MMTENVLADGGVMLSALLGRVERVYVQDVGGLALVLPILSRWLHIGAVIAVVGGTVFMRFVLHPSASKSLSPEAHDALRDAVRSRWSMILHTLILVIIVTGVYNLICVVPTLKSAMPYHAIFGAKLLLALCVFFIAIAVAGKSAAFEKMRRSAPAWMLVSVVLAACIVLLSVILKNISAPLGGG